MLHGFIINKKALKFNRIRAFNKTKRMFLFHRLLIHILIAHVLTAISAGIQTMLFCFFLVHEVRSQKQFLLDVVQYTQ